MPSVYDEFAALLLAHKVVSPGQLVEAWQIAHSSKSTLDQTLVILGYASAEEIARARAAWAGLPWLNLAEMTIPPAIIELVPESVARENVVLPVSLDGRALTVAMAELDLDVLEKLQFILNREIRPALAVCCQIVEAINRHYGPSETESVDSMLAEFTDTAIDFTETEQTFGFDLELACSEPERAESTAPACPAPRLARRRATVRYYHRMNPQRLFPLLVILSRAEVEGVAKRGVRQAQSQSFAVAEGSLVEIEPVLPGCSCYPPREQVRVGPGVVSVSFQVVPEVLGRVAQARVVVRQDGETLAEAPLEVRVVRQGVTKLMGALSLVLPFLLFLLKQFGLDPESQAKEGYGLYAQAAGWLLRRLTPEVLTALLLAATVGLYFWLRPRRRDVFQDITTREPVADPVTAPTAAPADAEDLYGKAKRAFARADQREGERLLGELLSAKPLHTAGLLLLAERRDQAGSHAEALALYERALATGRCGAVAWFRASLSAHRAGETARALDVLRRAEKDLPPAEMKGPLWYNMGCFAARLGRYPDALRYLNRAVDAGFADLEKYRGDPDLAPLRWHAGFRRLLAEIAR
jgi:tetratricopeptide (TPR) repeat protein